MDYKWGHFSLNGFTFRCCLLNKITKRTTRKKVLALIEINSLTNHNS